MGAVEAGMCQNPVLAPPQYLLANVQSGHLEHVKEAFDRLGYEATQSAEEDWAVMWAFHSPFFPREGEPDIPAITSSISRTQMVNHIPGAPYFASKRELARMSGALPFLPRTFDLDEEQAEFEQYAAAYPDTEWVVKGQEHRGVSFVTAKQALADTADKQHILAQQLIRPHLVDSKLWDIGVYVAVASVDPLRLYVYDNLLLRHCSENYTQDLARAVPQSYVVAENYSPPWALPSLRPLYAKGFSTLNVIRAHMHDNGLDFDAILDEIKTSVVELLLHVLPQLRTAAATYPHGATSFFSLYRFDFIVDRALKPWLIEVNQSPNLSSSSTPDLKNMFQRIAHDLLSLLGFAPGQLRHPHSPSDIADIVAHHSALDIGWRVCSACGDACAGRCAICRRCRTAEQTRMLQEVVSEQHNRKDFLRLYPRTGNLTERSSESSSHNENDALLAAWLLEKCVVDSSWC